MHLSTGGDMGPSMTLSRYLVNRHFGPSLRRQHVRGLLYCLALLACALPSKVSGEDVAKKVSFTFDQRATAEIQSKAIFIEYAGSYSLNARFDAVPAATSGVLRVGILNTEDFDLPIGKITVSCSCAKAALMDSVLRAGQTTDLIVELDSPKRHGSGLFTTVLELEIDKSSVRHKKLTHIAMLLSCNLSGLLCFQDQLVTTRVYPDRAAKLNLPFVNTLNVPEKSLVLDATDDVLGVEGEILRDSEKSYVSLVIDPKTLGTKRAFGTISISDPSGQVSDQVRIVLVPEAAVEINPSQIQFRTSSRNEGSTESLFTANAILRLGATSPEGNYSACCLAFGWERREKTGC